MVHLGSCAFLSSYLYHQPLPESQKSQKSAQIATSGKQNLLLERHVADPTSVQALRTLFAHGRRLLNGPLQWFGILIELFISPAPPRISKICPERPSGATMDALAREVPFQTSVQALRTLFTHIPRSPCGSYQ